jgi:multidrug efflux pump
VLGAIVAVVMAGLSFDVYAQIGLVVLIALAADRTNPNNARRLQQARNGLPVGRQGRVRAERRPEIT